VRSSTEASSKIELNATRVIRGIGSSPMTTTRASAVRPAIDRRLDEAMTDHAVADDDDPAGRFDEHRRSRRSLHSEATHELILEMTETRDRRSPRRDRVGAEIDVDDLRRPRCEAVAHDDDPIRE
jgi:hypothetical protein